MLEELDLRGERLQYKRLGAELVAVCAFLLDTSLTSSLEFLQLV